MENQVVIAYLVYLAISVSMTVWVARTLHRNGSAFLEEAFHGNARLSESVNDLLVVGFYLINLGYVSLALTMDHHPSTLPQTFEFLSHKLGWVLVILGIMHFFNIYMFSRFRKSALLQNLMPPITPDAERV